MTSWPWMQGLKEAIADAIPPVDEFDKRPSVKGLIQEHRAKIDEVHAGLKADPLYDPSKHDDLWVLRFVLSHKGSAKKAVAAAKGSLLFRLDMNLGDKDMRKMGFTQETCDNEAMKRYIAYAKEDFAQGVVPDVRFGAIILLKFSSLDQHGLIENVAEEDWLPTFTHVNEWSFQWCDYVTRTTGRLTKLIRIVDSSDVSMSMLNKECSRRDTTAMNTMEDFYPQLLQSVFICNAPSWIQVPWRILRPLIPKRVMDKMDIVDPNNSSKERMRLRPYISEQNLPARFGGGHDSWPVSHPLPNTAVAVENEMEC